MEDIIAVQKPSIVNPGTTRLATHKRNTFIRKANIPKVTIVIGSAISCKIGLIKEFIMPMTRAATIAAVNPSISKPGTRYATTYSAKTLRINRIINFISTYILNYYEKKVNLTYFKFSVKKL